MSKDVGREEAKINALSDDCSCEHSKYAHVRECEECWGSPVCLCPRFRRPPPEPVDWEANPEAPGTLWQATIDVIRLVLGR